MPVEHLLVESGHVDGHRKRLAGNGCILPRCQVIGCNNVLVVGGLAYALVRGAESDFALETQLKKKKRRDGPVKRPQDVFLQLGRAERNRKDLNLLNPGTCWQTERGRSQLISPDDLLHLSDEPLPQGTAGLGVSVDLVLRQDAVD